MNRVVVVFVVGLVLACSTKQSFNSSERPKALSARETAVLDDSIKAVVATYEAGGLALGEASKQLADLVEPLGGLPTEATRARKRRSCSKLRTRNNAVVTPSATACQTRS